MVNIRRRSAKTVIWAIGILVVLLATPIVSSLWRYTSWYPKVWTASIVVDGVSSPASALYLDRGRKCGGVVVQRTVKGDEFYAVGFGTCHNWRFVWRCDELGIS